MTRQTMLQVKKESQPLQTGSLFRRQAAQVPVEEHDTAPLPVGFGRDYSHIPFRPPQPPPPMTSVSCPFSPQRCPFGGACHACPPKVQAKLKIGQPGDRYEQEADRVAETVMRMPEPQAQRKCSAPGCKDEDDEKKLLQTKPASAGEAGAQADHPLIQSVLSSPGQPLDAGTRSFMEPRFGQDFSGVRVHVGGEAAESARAVNARAYTVGRDVVFGEGQYVPGSDEGKRLMAHELAHVGQQGAVSNVQYFKNKNVVTIDQHKQKAARVIQRDSPKFYGSTAPTSISITDQQRAVQLQDLQTQIDTQTDILNRTRGQLKALPPASSQRTALEAILDQTRLGLLLLLEIRSSLLTTEIQCLHVRIGPNPQSSPDRPGLYQLGNELNQREQELQNHRRQIVPLRVWQTQHQVEATQQQIEGVNQKIMNLPPLDPDHPTSDMNDPRVQELMRQREALEQQKQTQTESAGEQWTRIDLNTRMAYVMDLLVTKYGYPANGAAGLVGNLNAESGVLPQRLEGSQASAPMKTSSFQSQSQEFTPQEVMNRSSQQQSGPRLPGVGLAQWTTGSRRTGLFQHQFGGRRMGTDILFNMDAQVDYLVSELQSNYPGVNRVLTNSGTSVNDACDDVVYNFEVPGALLDENKHKRPRTDPQVVQVFNQRRPSAQLALTSFNKMS